jgi:hypothetical protein
MGDGQILLWACSSLPEAAERFIGMWQVATLTLASRKVEELWYGHTVRNKESGADYLSRAFHGHGALQLSKGEASRTARGT